MTYSSARAALFAGETSCRRLVTDALETAGASRQFNAFLELYEDALDEAEKIDARIAAGRGGPLAGLTVAVKDNMCRRGKRLSCGSRILEGFTSVYDATALRRLLEADAILIGRTNMDEFAMGSSNENSAFGPVLNPADPERVPGGSSGGSAVAVASGAVMAALGSDTGGSVRQPAAFTGVVGLKPGYGRISRHGLVAFASSLDQIGIFSSNVEDAARVLSVIAGHDPRDSTSDTAPSEDYTARLTEPIKGLRVGIPGEFLPPELEEGPRAAVDRAAAAFHRIDAGVVPVSLPHSCYTIAPYAIIATAEASSNLARFDGIRYGLRRAGDSPGETNIRTRSSGFGGEVKRRIMLGAYVLSAGYVDAYYRRAQKVRTLIARDFEEAFRGADLLMTPTTPGTAFRLGERVRDPLKMYLSDLFTASANLAGLPAMHVPAGRDAEGLPVGVQLIAPERNEALMLRAAATLERELQDV